MLIFLVDFNDTIPMGKTNRHCKDSLKSPNRSLGRMETRSASQRVRDRSSKVRSEDIVMFLTNSEMCLIMKVKFQQW